MTDERRYTRCRRGGTNGTNGQRQKDSKELFRVFKLPLLINRLVCGAYFVEGGLLADAATGNKRVQGELCTTPSVLN